MPSHLRGGTLHATSVAAEAARADSPANLVQRTVGGLHDSLGWSVLSRYDAARKIAIAGPDREALQRQAVAQGLGGFRSLVGLRCL